MNTPKRYRYPGVKPFSESESDIFFGREADVEQLHDLVLLEKLVVLFGKSGYGKSSLLNAGLIPLLTDPTQEQFQYTPVSVRLYPYAEGVTPTPVETTRLKILQTVAQDADETFLKYLTPELSLWLHCKRLQARTGGRIVLLFDQFEEFFSYPPEQQAEFRQQLAELLYTAIPQSIRNRMSELSAAERSQLVAPLNVKALLSIRADRLSLLDSMKVDLPDILQRRYELRPLSSEQAKDAMVRPAALKAGDDFATPPFGYTDAAIEKVVQHLLDPLSNGVEAFLLQVACLSIESRIEAGLLAGRSADPLPLVDALDWPPLANIMDDYYHQQIAKITPTELQAEAYRLIEDRLIFVHPETGDARRLSMDSTALQASQALLDSLVNHFLIRREANALGGNNYELCHDRLLEPALASQGKWLETEELRAAERAEAERRKQLEELQRVAVLERRRRQRASLLAGAAVAGFIVAGILGVWAYSLKEVAERSQSQTENLLSDIQKVEEQLRRRLTEVQKERNRADSAFIKSLNATYHQFESEGKSAMESSEYEQAIRNFNSALSAIDERPEVIPDNGESCRKLLSISKRMLTKKDSFDVAIQAGDAYMEQGVIYVLEAIDKYEKALKTGFNDGLAESRLSKTIGEKKAAFLILKDRGIAFANAGRCDYAVYFLNKARKLFQDDEVENKMKSCSEK